MPTTVITSPDADFVVGNNHRFINAPLKDGVDNTWSQVYLILINPHGTVSEKTCTASGSDWYYDTLSTDLATAGLWTRRWRCVASGIDNQDSDIRFSVVSRQGA
jgi:hypothetical protein